MLKGQRYDEKVDLWAIGILAYELLIGNSPFEINEQQDLIKIVKLDIILVKIGSKVPQEPENLSRVPAIHSAHSQQKPKGKAAEFGVASIALHPQIRIILDLLVIVLILICFILIVQIYITGFAL